MYTGRKFKLRYNQTDAMFNHIQVIKSFILLPLALYLYLATFTWVHLEGGAEPLSLWLFGAVGGNQVRWPDAGLALPVRVSPVSRYVSEYFCSTRCYECFSVHVGGSVYSPCTLTRWGMAPGQQGGLLRDPDCSDMRAPIRSPDQWSHLMVLAVAVLVAWESRKSSLTFRSSHFPFLSLSLTFPFYCSLCTRLVESLSQREFGAAPVIS